MPFRHLLFRRSGNDRDASAAGVGAGSGATSGWHVMPSQPSYQFSFPSRTMPHGWSEMDFDIHHQSMNYPASNEDANYLVKQDTGIVHHLDEYNGPNFHVPDLADNGDINQTTYFDPSSGVLPRSFDETVENDTASLSHSSICSSRTSITYFDSVHEDDAHSRPSNSRKVSDFSTGESCHLPGQPGVLASKTAPYPQGSPCEPTLHYMDFEGSTTGDERPELSFQPVRHPFPASVTTSSRLSSYAASQTSLDHYPVDASIHASKVDLTVASSAVDESQAEDGPRPKPRARRATSKPKASSTRSVAENEGPELSTMDREASKRRARQAHSLVERKYRENLNAKIMELHRTLQDVYPGPQASSSSSRPSAVFARYPDDTQMEDDPEDTNPERSEHGRLSSLHVPAAKVKKSDVLTDAMSYIHTTQVQMQHMAEEITRLRRHVHTLEDGHTNRRDGPGGLRQAGTSSWQ